MNYTEITNMSLSYTDRTDKEVIDNIPNYLIMVESRVNKLIKSQKMAARTVLLTDVDTEYYGLPGDFAGLRDIEIVPVDAPTKRETLEYLNPQQMNEYVNNSGTNISAVAKIYYTIVANQLQIYPPQDRKILEIVYYQQLSPLTKTDFINWLADAFPEVYIYGICAEISAFVKDIEAYSIWNQRFMEVLNDLAEDDQKSRWSGTTLRVRVD